MGKSHVSRTLEMLRKEGIDYAQASGYNSFSKKRWDLIGVIDYIAFYPNGNEFKLVGIQICGRDFQSHIRKINASRLAKKWIESNNIIMIIGWRKLKGGWSSRTHFWRKRGDFSSVLTSPLSSSKVPEISEL